MLPDTRSEAGKLCIILAQLAQVHVVWHILAGLLIASLALLLRSAGVCRLAFSRKACRLLRLSYQKARFLTTST